MFLVFIFICLPIFFLRYLIFENEIFKKWFWLCSFRKWYQIGMYSTYRNLLLRLLNFSQYFSMGTAIKNIYSLVSFLHKVHFKLCFWLLEAFGWSYFEYVIRAHMSADRFFCLSIRDQFNLSFCFMLWIMIDNKVQDNSFDFIQFRQIPFSWFQQFSILWEANEFVWGK